MVLFTPKNGNLGNLPIQTVGRGTYRKRTTLRAFVRKVVSLDRQRAKDTDRSERVNE
jgi:hypothetical protein